MRTSVPASVTERQYHTLARNYSSHTFSAFWLWSSVVSVLISVKTDRLPCAAFSLSQNFLRGVSGLQACLHRRRCCACSAHPQAVAHPIFVQYPIPHPNISCTVDFSFGGTGKTNRGSCLQSGELKKLIGGDFFVKFHEISRCFYRLVAENELILYEINS